ncbi:MAG: AsmA [Acidobacteriales bacterium]|nr:AsmA [Terriglobales bacterium]
MSGTGKRGKRVAVALVIILLLALFVPPFVNANRFRARLAQSVSGAIGRPVSMGNVNIRLLPRPGFEIENFVIADDSTYSAEPLLRSEKVVASVRLTSLWRGRFEIARLALSYPSLNLVRNAEGHWNIESLLRHASQIQTAPTAKKRPESRPRFPYIEADQGRINFKILHEKKAHVLVDADFALWLESENQWNMRLEARPTRTDANLGDTGTLRVEGSFERADKIEQTPLKLHLAMEKAQLGQLTTLIYGRDRGWRGDVSASGTLQGTPEDFTATATANINDFRRYDISSNDSFRITADCTARHSTLLSSETDFQRNHFDCKLPFAEGNVTVQGAAKDWPLSLPYFSLKAESLPIATVARLFRHAKRDVPADLTGGGTINGYISRISYPGAAPPKWTGEGVLEAVSLSSQSIAQSIQVDTLRFGFDEVELSPEGRGSRGLRYRLDAKPTRTKTRSATDNVSTTLTVDPFAVSLGGAGSLNVSGIGTHEGLQWRIKGEAEAAKLNAAARLLGLPIPGSVAAGTANIDLAINNAWTSFGAPVVTGNAQLHRVKAQIADVAAPIEIASATLVLTPDEISLQHLTGTLFGTRTQFDGGVVVRRNCVEQYCPVRFELHATEINLDELNRILNPKFRETNWLGQQTSSPTNAIDSRLLNLDLNGKLTADRLIMKGLIASNLATQVAKDNGVVNLTAVRADLLGGKHLGNWRATFSGNEVKFEGSGALQEASLSQVSALTHDNWGAGVIDAGYKLSLSGTDADALRRTLAGSLNFNWKNGSLRRVVGTGFPAGLQFARWTGTVKIDSGSLQWLDSVMDAATGKYRVSGSATLARDLELRFTGDKHRFDLSGTLDKPETTVTVIPPSSESASNQQNASTPKAHN